MRNALTAAAAVLCLTTAAHGQCPRWYAPAPAGPVVYQAMGTPYTMAPAAPVQQAMAPTTPMAPAAGDAYGFTGWLNGVRAQYGLPAVAYDPGLEADARTNSAMQAARGLGHWYMGAARRQNSAMGGYASIGAMWLASPAHRAALLDPTITRVGLAGLGVYWTFSAF